MLLPALGGRHIYFRYNATSFDMVDNTIEQLDLENMGIAVIAWNSVKTIWMVVCVSKFRQ